MQQKLNWYGDLSTNGENFSQGKNSIKWFLSHHSQESISQEQVVTSIRSQNTHLQLNLYSNPQLDLIL